MDDFGTGYPSLERPRPLRPSMIKIDRSFVKDLPHDHDAGTLVETMTTLARATSASSASPKASKPRRSYAS
jgi:EAL domain-containing protein (putative c-di-GMP-specific phosphodiesterase class I)